MKKVMFTLYSLVTIMLIVVGLYRAIHYAGKDWTLFGFFLGMHLLGVAILIIYALYLMYKKSKSNNNSNKQ